ncbi:hypothetical protein GGU10DRAFT_270475 [Lentinula aff. detonsa]|uniref:Uncharacterized protein n=1 Tax=Lentinula aff. detonsa TaxID=2804958 RepID=A0AA38L578_9AGAR|nr:hypothetical protein GGU10DRAFT_270475 [Lentinula aff. detonsa]
MPKLHLKRTPEEEAARRLRKKEKKEAKRRRKEDHYGDNSSSSKRRHQTAAAAEESTDRKWDSYDDDDDDDDEFIGPIPGPSNHRSDYETLHAELEEKRFREKIAMAFEDDERLDSIEARFNCFAHVPVHWGGRIDSKPRINYDNDEFLAMDPMSMDDEEYAEWIRVGMYRKSHAQEIAEKERLKAERAARRAHEKAVRAETERLEKLAAAERRSRRQEKENQRLELSRSEYHNRWKLLLSNTSADMPQAEIGFDDIPWPILPAFKKSDKKSASDNALSLSLDDFTRGEISTFLFTSSVPSADSSIDTAIGKTNSPSSSSTSAQRLAETEMAKARKDRKEKLRETLLRFHPDKFEGRLMSRVRPDEKVKVTEALAIVVRVLNDLMGEG